MFKSKEREFDKIYQELINDLPSVKMFHESYSFGVATVISSLLHWCNELDKNGFKNVKPDEIRVAFKNFYEYNPNVKKYIERLEEDYKKI